PSGGFCSDVLRSEEPTAVFKMRGTEGLIRAMMKMAHCAYGSLTSRMGRRSARASGPWNAGNRAPRRGRAAERTQARPPNEPKLRRRTNPNVGAERTRFRAPNEAKYGPR